MRQPLSDPDGVSRGADTHLDPRMTRRVSGVTESARYTAHHRTTQPARRCVVQGELVLLALWYLATAAFVQ